MTDEQKVTQALNRATTEDVVDKTTLDEDESSESDEYTSNLPWQNNKSNVYDRNKLYDEVWANPVVHVAVQYGVSGTAIKKVCKTLNIPVPPRGYWAKLKAGKPTKKIPLPKSEGRTVFYGARTQTNKPIETIKVSLAFLPEAERQQIVAAAGKIEMSPENTRLHKKISAYKAVVNDWNKNDRKEECAQRKYSNYYNKPPFLAGVVSIETLPRVYRLLDALYRQVESLGGTVNDDLTLKIRGEILSLEITEGQDKVIHEITREEARALVLYEDAKKHRRWASEPQIRKYDYLFNGRLRVSIRQNKFFKDTEKGKLEDRLGDIFIELYEESELLRLARNKREEEARKREEEAIKRQQFNEMYNSEVERTTALANAALDHEKAVRIRAYINAVESSFGAAQINEETAAWLAWAKDKADWFDPIKAHKDEYFGKRHHEDDESSKMFKKINHYW